MASGLSRRRGGRTAFRRVLTTCFATILGATGVIVIGASPAAAVGTPSIDSSPSNPTLADPLAWTFSNADPAVCQLVDPNGTTVASQDGCTSPTSFDVSSGPAGSYTLTVYATDAASNIDGSTPSASDSVDVAPLPPTYTDEPTTPFNDPTPTWNFTLDSGATATCELDHPAGTAIQTVPNCTSPFTADDLTASTTNGDPGNYRLSVVQTVAGIDSAPAHSVYDFETAKPSTPNVTADDSLGFDKHPTFSVTQLDANATPTCTVTPSANASVSNCGASPSLNLSSASDGVYTLHVTQTFAGNVSDEGSDTYQLDTHTPNRPTVTADAAYGSSASPSFTVTGIDGDAQPECSVSGPSNVSVSQCDTSTVLDLTGADAGTYVVSVDAKDAAGKSGPADTASYEYLPSAPPAPQVQAAAAAGNDQTPSFSVSDAEDVTLTYDCTVTAATTNASLTVPAPACNPTTVLDLTNAPDDTYTLTVTATDQLGQTSTVGSDTYTLDTSTPAPTVSLSSPASSPSTVTTPTFTITDAESVAGPDTFTCEWDAPNGSTISSGNCASGDTFGTAGNGNGRYTLTVTAHDSVGNSSTAAPVNYVLESTAPPAPSITVVGSNPSSSPTALFTVTDSENVNLTYTCDVVGWPASVVTSCGPTTAIDLGSAGDGIYTLHVKVTDELNQTSPNGSATYTLDTIAQAPTVTLASPASSPSTDTNPRFTITDNELVGGPDDFTCTWDGPGVTDVAPCASGDTFPAVADGDYTLSVTATDATGNTSTTAGTATYSLDASTPDPPTVALATPASSPGKATVPTFTVSNPGDTSPGGLTYDCTVTETSVTPNVTVAASDVTCGPATTVHLGPTGDGDYSVSVTATDAAGNTSSGSGVAFYTLDSAVPATPAVTLATPASSPGQANNPTFTVSDPGDTSPGGLTYACTVTKTSVTPNVVLPGSAVSCGTTTSVDLSGTGDGAYTLSVTATDGAGNTSAAGSASYTLDATAPAAPTVTRATPASSPGSAKTPTFTVSNPGDVSPGGLTYDCTVTETSVTPNVTVAASDVTCGPVTTVRLAPTGDGDYTLAVTASDAAGNPSTSAGTATYTLDSATPAAPVVTLATPASSPGQATNPTFTVSNPGDTSPGGLTYDCTVTETSVTPTVTVPASDVTCGSVTSVNLGPSGDGDYSLEVTATDAAGNTSTTAGTATYSLDTTAPAAPTVTLATPASSPGQATIPTFTVSNPGDTSPGGLTYDCTVTETSVAPNVMVAASDVTCGPATTVHLGPTGDGDYSLAVTATDAAGNASTTAGTATYSLDTTAPGAPTVVLATPASSPGKATVPTFTVSNPGDTSPGGLTYDCTVTETSVTPNVVLPGSAVTCGTTTTVDLSGTGDGDYFVSVTATDAAGNLSAAAGTATYTLDATRPGRPTVTLATPASSPGQASDPTFSVSDPGDSSPGGLTYACTVTETSVTPNVVLPGSAVTCGTTTTVDLSGTGDGDYTLAVTATDAAGNTSLAGTASYSMDTTAPAAPTVTLTTPASSPSNVAIPTFTVSNPGDVSPGGLTYDCTVTETSVTPTVTVAASDVTCGPTTTVDLGATGDGDYSVSVTATDAAGNPSTSAGTATYTLDSATPASPVVTLATPASSPGQATVPTFTVVNPGDTSPGGLTYDCTVTETSVTPTVTVPASDVTCGSVTSVNLGPSGDGDFTLSVTATDAAGNTSAAGTASYSLDTTAPAAPTVTLATPASSPGQATVPTFTVTNPGDVSPGGLTYDCTVTETSVTPNVTVAASDVTCGPTTTVDVGPTGDGDYTLSVTATDAAGNPSTTAGTATYSLDTTAPGAPVVTLATPAASPGSATSPTFTVTNPGDTSPGGLTYDCTVTETSVTPNVVLPGSAVTCGPTTTVDLGATGDGDYSVSVTATDAAGNTSAAPGTETYTLDSTVPATPVVTLATPATSPGNSSAPTFTVANPGDVSPGGLTYDCTVTETSVTPNVVLPASAVGCGTTTTVDLSGTGDGDYTLAVTVTDAAGNTSAAAGTAAYTLDATTPAAPAVTLATPASSPGQATVPTFTVVNPGDTSPGGLTYDCTVTETSVTPNVTVAASDVTCGPTTTVDLTATGDGDYSVSVTATDAAGNTSASAGTATYKLDTTQPAAPTVTLATPASSPGQAAVPTFTVTNAGDVSPGGLTYDCTVTETSVTPTVIVPAADVSCGPVTTVNLAPTGDGDFTLAVTATDTAGNTSAAGTASYSLDTTAPAAPTVTLATPAASPGQAQVPTFTVTNPGDVSPGGLTYDCTVTETSVTPNVTVAASDVGCGPTTTVDLTATGDGDYSVSVTATDAAGNTSATAGSATYNLDNTNPAAPTVTLATPTASPGSATSPTFTVTNPGDTSPGGLTYDCTVTETSATPNVTVAASDVSCGPTTTVDLTATGDGDYTLSVTATDAAGNTGAAGAASYTLDATTPAAPTVTLATPASSPGNATTPTFSVTDPGDVSPGGLTYDCTVTETSVTPNVVLPGSAVTCGTTTSADLSGTGDGDYTLLVTVTDAAGNTGAAGAASYTLDATTPAAPSVTLATPASSPGKATVPTFNVTNPGDVSPGGLTYDCTVTETSVTPNVTVAASDVTCGPTTTVDLTATGDGDYTLSVTATDAAGNTSATAGTATYTLDTTQPAAPTVTLTSPATSPGNARTAQFTVADPDNSPGGFTFSCVVTDTSATPQVTLPASDVTCGSSTTVDLSAAADGDYVLAVTATDAAGNSSAAGTASYTLDATAPAAPTVTRISPVASPGNSASPQFSVTSPGDTSPGGVTYTCTATFKTSPAGPVNPVPAGDVSCGPTASLDLSTLSDARYTLSVTATDASGNTGPAGTASYTYDATAPSTPVVTLTSPASSPGNATTATFSVANPGDASPGGLTYSCTVTETSVTPAVTVLASDVTCGPTTTLDLATVSDGDYQLSVTATDKAGNSSATPGTATYTLDTNRPGAPTVTLSVPASSPGNVTSPQFTVTDPDGSPGGLTFSCSVTGRTVVPQSAITCGPTTTVDLSGAGRDGGYTLSVTATDAAGNTSAAAGTASYMLDTTAPGTPAVTLTSPPTSPGNSTSPQFSVSNAGDVSPGGLTYDCTVTETSATPSPVVPASDVTCGPTTTIDLSTSPDGTYTLAVIATDAAGNSSAAAGTATYAMDTTAPPAPSITLPGASTKVPVFGISDGDPTVRLSCLFLAPNGRTVFPVSGPNTCPANGSFDTTAFADGDYTLTVTATDPAGNATSTTVTWTRDTTPPPVPTVTAPASPSNDRSPTFTIGDAEAGAILTCLLTGPDSSGLTEFSGACPANGQIPIAGQDGVYTLTVTASDAAGNVSPTTASASYTLDTTRPNQPTVTRTSPAASPDNTTQVRFAVSDPDSSPGGITYSCSVSGPTAVPAAQISCGTTTTLDLSGPGRDGTYTLSVIATDAAQNSSQVAGTASYTLDTTPPPAPTPTLSVPASSPGHVVSPAFLVTDTENSPGLTFGCSVTGATPVPASDINCGPTTTVDLRGTGRDGDYTLSVTATDAAGNTSTSAGTATYTLDTVVPLDPVVGLASATRSSLKSPLWTWEYGFNDLDTVVDTATCTINGPHGYTSTKTDCGHHYSPTLGGGDGVYRLTITLTDPAGNTAAATSPSYTLDDTAPAGPTVFLKRPSHFAGLDRHPVWSVSGPAKSTLMCTLLHGGPNGTPAAPEAVCPTPTTYSLVGFNDGLFTLKVVAVDSVHNRSFPATAAYVLAPKAPQVDAPKGNASHAVWTVVGNPHDGFVCTLMHAGSAVAGPRTCGAHPAYDMSGRPAGTYTLSVVQVGAEGVHSEPGTASWDWVGQRANNHPQGNGPPQGNNPTGPSLPGGFGPRNHQSPKSSSAPPPNLVPAKLRQQVQHGGGEATSIIPPFVQSVHPNRLADAVSSAVQGVVSAVGAAGGGTGFPLLLLGLVLAFLIAQNRIDRRDPKLALASIAADDLVEFKVPPSRRDRL